MTRTYTLRKRAQSQAETRRRIVEAAIALHGSVGPARTTFSMVAERAGVQRHTLYAHFPDEWSLLLACSVLHLESDPLPDAAPWQVIADHRTRLRTGLDAIYAWYERNADLIGCVLRDVESHPPTQKIAELRFGPPFAAYREVLGEGLSARQRAVLRLGLSYFTWRTLAIEGALKQSEAVAVMVEAINAAK